MKAVSKYKPLIVIIAVIVLASWAISYNDPNLNFMPAFMGLFFIIFAMFKLIDLLGFVKGFAMYDLLTKRYRNYAYAYPFIELVLGLFYLAGFVPVLTNLVTVIIMFISAAGVILSIKRGMNLKCACLGTTLEVPLSTVSIIENVGMGVMALVLLV